MKTLTLHLSDAIDCFNSLPPEERAKIENILGGVLEGIIEKKVNEDLLALLDKTSEQAERNGLTIAKVAELMEWDKQTVKNLFGEELAGNDQ